MDLSSSTGTKQNSEIINSRCKKKEAIDGKAEIRDKENQDAVEDILSAAWLTQECDQVDKLPVVLVKKTVKRKCAHLEMKWEVVTIPNED